MYDNLMMQIGEGKFKQHLRQVSYLRSLEGELGLVLELVFNSIISFSYKRITGVYLWPIFIT